MTNKQKKDDERFQGMLKKNIPKAKRSIGEKLLLTIGSIAVLIVCLALFVPTGGVIGAMIFFLVGGIIKIWSDES